MNHQKKEEGGDGEWGKEGVGFRPLVLGEVEEGEGGEGGEWGEEGLGDGRGGRKMMTMMHSDIAEGNLESAGVAKGLGGVVGWSVRWVGVDMREVRKMAMTTM